MHARRDCSEDLQSANSWLNVDFRWLNLYNKLPKMTKCSESFLMEEGEGSEGHGD